VDELTEPTPLTGKEKGQRGAGHLPNQLLIKGEPFPDGVVYG
jgi:hypothetical protein